MRSVLSFLILGLAVSFFPLVGCQPAGEPEAEKAPAPEAPPAAVSEEDALGQIAGEFAKAWNAADAEAIGALFTADGDSVGLDGEMSLGRQQVTERYAGLFKGLYKGTTFSVTTTSIRFLQPDVAIVDGAYEIHGMKDAEGNELPMVKGLYTNVTVKEGDRWHIACSRPMIPVEAPGTT